MNAQTQSVKSSRGLAGEDRSYHDPEQGLNLALAGVLQELRNKGELNVAPSGETSPMEGEGEVETPVGTMTQQSAATVDEATSPEAPPPADAGNTAEASATPDRRGVFHQAARDHVAGVQAARSVDVQPKEDVVRRPGQFVVAPLAPLDQGQRKPKQLPKDAPWERVTLGVFQKNKNAELLSLVRAIRARGARPVMTLEIRAPEGVGTRVDFGLSIAVEKGGYEHVKLTPIDGFGLFWWFFKGVEVFHDEVMGEKPAHPDRYPATVGVNATVNQVSSFLASRRLARPSR